MNVSSLSSGGYNYTPSDSTRSAKRSNGNPFEKALESLQSALQSGDTSSAQTILSELLSHQAKHASATGDSSESTNPLATSLKDLQSALESGDTTTAQSVISSLQTMAQNPPPPPPPTNGAGRSNPMEKALTSIQSSLSSGDITTAQSILSDLLSHSPKAQSAGSSDTQNSSSTSSTTSSTSSLTSFEEYLKSIQSALSSGDTTGAENILSSLKDFLAANPPPAPPGIGSYDTRGAFQQQTSGTSSLSALA